ncbi:hypothetical protein [Pinibacter aurantiacus]|uniref:BZIP transcription factor n=1 Tax=Pinibacter aurantiacus TaxID=2851599 RepID=A0A9E2S9B8_9BACT|nr:hypothetical protein [Pinibacter aurantiacus]MBV4358898.1 hypothetical protein [Pinibacter aurantiacus]
MKKIALILLACCLTSVGSFAQNKFPGSGYAGIGTETPEQLLHIKSTSTESNYGLKIEGFQGFSAGMRLQNNTAVTGKTYSIYSSSDGDFILGDENLQKAKMAIWNTGEFHFDGDVAIGSLSENEGARQLSVNGVTRAGGYECFNGSLDWGQRHFTLQSFSGKARFSIGLLGDESSNSAGANFSIWRYDDDGGFLAQAFCINRKSGNVGIGTAAPSEMLAVNGNIRAQKVIVTTNGWADYVFESSYKLPALDSIAAFIKTNKHLPEMPAAAAVEKDGQDLGEIQKLLLKKIEELTLYTIQLQQENKDLKSRVEKLETSR